MELKSKREAAQILGLSTRGIERAVRRGQLAVRYRPGKHGVTAWFADGDLTRYQKVQQSRFPVGFTTGIAGHPADSGLTIGTVMPMVDVEPWPRRRSAPGKKKERSVSISEQLAVTLADAAKLSGLPRAFIDESVEQGRLRSFKIGNDPYVKRSDLEAFVQSL